VGSGRWDRTLSGLRGSVYREQRGGGTAGFMASLTMIKKQNLSHHD